VRRYHNVRRSLAVLLSFVLLTAIGAAAFSQEKSLAITTGKVSVDGVVSPGEYSFSQDFDSISVYAKRTADALYLAAVGDSTGWVALGLGSLRMDGSTIFMGFVDRNGTVQFKPQAGSGHSHRDVGAEVSATIISYAMKEANGKTTLEIALKPAAYIKAGQKDLQMIYAVGTEKSFIPRHMARGALRLTLVQ
jgi:hypothetical protein